MHSRLSASLANKLAFCSGALGKMLSKLKEKMSAVMIETSYVHYFLSNLEFTFDRMLGILSKLCLVQ